MKRFFGLVVVLGLGGCGGHDLGADDIDSGPVSGLIGGSNWTMKVADVQTDAFDASKLSVRLFADDTETCGFGSSDQAFVLFSIDATVGEYPLSFSLGGDGHTVTLVEPPSQNNIATKGLIDVKSVSDDSVEIGLVAEMDDDNTVNGTFSADRCPAVTF